jgi:hypothetical protein
VTSPSPSAQPCTTSRRSSSRSSTTTALARTSRAAWSTIIGYDTSNDPSGVPADATAWDGGQLTGMFAFFGILAMAVAVSTADHGTGGIVPGPRRASPSERGGRGPLAGGWRLLRTDANR